MSKNTGMTINTMLKRGGPIRQLALRLIREHKVKDPRKAVLKVVEDAIYCRHCGEEIPCDDRAPACFHPNFKKGKTAFK